MSKSSGSAPTPPRLKQIDIPGTEKLATAADVHGYNLSDTDFTSRFPDLAKGRDYNVNNSVANLNGATDPTISNAFTQSGLTAPNLGKNEFQQARSLGQPILAKEQRDRTYFQTMLADNPQRAFGLSGGDVANLAVANVTGQNQINQNLYGLRNQSYNQNLLQNAQLSSALIGGIGSLASAGIKSYGSSTMSPFLNYSQYAPNIPYVPGSGDPTYNIGG